MAYETKPNSGAMFRAKDRKNENWPEFEGSAVIDGQEYWLSAWVNKAKSDGSKYFSLKFKPKTPPSVGAKLSSSRSYSQDVAESGPVGNDDVPF
jgi:hypothetical protein